MDKKNIKLELSKLITEEAVSGENVTRKVQKTSKKTNDAYYSDVKEKMKDYDKSLKSEDDDAIDPVKNEYEDSEKEYHDEMEIRNGQEMLNYDNDPGEKFTDRAIKSIEGDSTMGNKTYTGEENGNTESVWGASDDEFGKKLADTIRSSKKKRDDSTPRGIQFGDDYETAEGEPKVKNKKNAIGEGMKKITFKKPFDGVQNAIKLIPEAFKKDMKVFEMTDGNEKYRMKWEGSLNEGKATIITASDNNMISEDYAKIKHLMGYKSEDTLGTPTADERVNENAIVAGFAEGNGFGKLEDEELNEEEVDETVGLSKWAKKEWAPGEEEEMDASVKASGERWDAKQKAKLDKQYADLEKSQKDKNK